MGRVTGTDSRAFSFYMDNFHLLYEPSGSGSLLERNTYEFV